MALQSFRTVAGAGEAEIIIKKSRFIAAVKRVESEAEAEAFLQEKRQEHPQAVHNCYAWRVGLGSVVGEKCGDDGEPQGTAGKPMLEVLRREELRNVAAVVTRYFGGILLGAPGLVRAYAGATKAGVDHVGTIIPELYSLLEVQLPYHLHGKVQHFLEQGGYALAGSEFAEQVRLGFWVPAPEAAAVAGRLTDLTDGQGQPTVVKEQYR